MYHNIRVIETLSNQLLFSTTIEEAAKAYAYAHEMEKLGIDVIVQVPSITETLAQSLGATEEGLEELNLEIKAEIASHQVPGDLSDDHSDLV